MSLKNHPDYEIEVNRLEYTKEYIDKTLDATEEYRKLYKENIKEAMLNLDYLDSSQSYISILINTKFMEMADRNYESLSRSRNKPYFARIDFRQKGEETIDKIYLGKTSLFRAEDSIPLIVDWRSPIANVYYEGRLGETSYEVEGNTQEGELLLKRQYSIEEGELQSILDIDLTTNDAFLQASLEANAEDKLKDIASTIQAEQNRVIRADMAKPLIVQGVAGSGKTTIALHRIAYFIYTYEKTFHPENFMIIAPNRLFLNYISEVLPELGVERVKQTTYVDFMTELVGTDYKIHGESNKLILLMNQKVANKASDHLSLLKWATAFKGSLEFKNIIDSFVEIIEDQFTPSIDFTFDGIVLMKAEEVKKMFIEELTYLPLYKRIPEIKKTLRNRLKLIKKEVLRKTEEGYDREIQRLRDTLEVNENRRRKIVELIDKRDNKLKKLTNTSKVLVKSYISKFPKKELFDYYSEFMNNMELFLRHEGKDLSSKQISYLTSKTLDLLANKTFQLEDLAPLVYLRYRIFGFDKKIEVNSVVVDEAQDFSLFQIYTLKEILKTNMITLLGDISQGIHSYRGIQSWEEVLDQVFDRQRSNYMTLVQSYRTTIEVMNLANEVIKKLNNPNIVLAKPVIRHGDKPFVKAFTEETSLMKDIEMKVLEMQERNYKSIAILCKTNGDCNKIKKYLDKHSEIRALLLDEKMINYNAGVMIVPSHLAKGLEFDAVIIACINDGYEENDLDIKLLYVAITRTLHRLFICYMKNKLPILSNMDDELITHIQ
ncbi:RNA polymerase recycling motor HelD [Alkaliphilus serpentinus]|uniref:DNA 3'-5' helicase n=1 Tax=Alkaliphilus serpentinus TaxID=1482731 RepID=A0A833M8T5_9FIRM|nr:RNA polymerase recycling motor HelD [Alkaliphilus serpentinus]KAB3527282.1 AAA family ATPase [Alkaliphilus serpentinus]